MCVCTLQTLLEIWGMKVLGSGAWVLPVSVGVGCGSTGNHYPVQVGESWGGITTSCLTEVLLPLGVLGGAHAHAFPKKAPKAMI